jgi:DNA gyrase subunit A
VLKVEGDLRELVPISIEDEMKKSYLDYAMSVIVSRAIPDARDGLKPVHRRILYSMYESSYYYNRPHRKSARIVGDVMGKYHPHGDAAIYDSLVRMAQSFSLRLPLVDGQGNFGSIDGDGAAAMRYTESRLAKAAHSLLEDIENDTINFQPNYDGSEHEPNVLPAAFPNLLVNGGGGIAVGMATNIPPHNLSEVIDACCMYVDNPLVTVAEMMEVVKGPDFPTAGMILGTSGIRSAFETGRGSVMMRGRAHIEDNDGREAIIITEIPYAVNKAKLVERIAELVREKKVEGITDLRDESDKSGIRVVVEVKRDAAAEVILNQLYTYTSLQTSFGVNMLALDNGRPRVMNLKDIIEVFIKFREEVITRRLVYLLNKARDKAHILIGLSIAVANIDEVIALIRTAADPQEARTRLLEKAWDASGVLELIKLVDDRASIAEDGRCYFTEEQAKAILDMRLQRLTGMEKEKIENDLSDLAKEITGYLDILGSRPRLLELLKEELLKIKAEFGTPRLTEVFEGEFGQDIEDLIQKEDMVVTVTLGGYIKRVPLSTYRSQRRGGKGRSGLSMRDEDITTQVFVGNTHTPMLFFSNIGQVYKLKLYKLPLGNPQSKGRPLVNLLPLKDKEFITKIMPLPENEEEWDNLHIMFATSKGNIRRNDLSDFKRIQSNGKIAIRLEDDDRLIGVTVCNDKDHILLAARNGKCLRFPVDAVRVFKSRTSDGVRGMKLAGGDDVISMTVLCGAEYSTEDRDCFLRIPVEKRMQIAKLKDDEAMPEVTECTLAENLIRDMARNEEFILTISENGFGKRSSAYEYRITDRGGSGIINMITSERNGNVVASMPITDNNEIMLMTDTGKLIRCPVHNVRITGRSTSGVIMFKTEASEKVVSVAVIAESEEDVEDAIEEAIESAEEIGVEINSDTPEENKE